MKIMLEQIVSPSLTCYLAQPGDGIQAGKKLKCCENVSISFPIFLVPPPPLLFSSQNILTLFLTLLCYRKFSTMDKTLNFCIAMLFVFLTILSLALMGGSYAVAPSTNNYFYLQNVSTCSCPACRR